MTGRYDDIINLPRPVSKRHAPMPQSARAAQFSAFAALSGYEDAVEETARLTERKIELDEGEKEELNAVFCALSARIERGETPEADVTYFMPDARKAGGEYVTRRMSIKKIDACAQRVIAADGTEIAMDDIISATGCRESGALEENLRDGIL